MKKALWLLSLVAVLVMAGAAFAADGGHTPVNTPEGGNVPITAEKVTDAEKSAVIGALPVGANVKFLEAADLGNVFTVDALHAVLNDISTQMAPSDTQKTIVAVLPAFKNLNTGWNIVKFDMTAIMTALNLGDTVNVSDLSFLAWDKTGSWHKWTRGETPPSFKILKTDGTEATTIEKGTTYLLAMNVTSSYIEARRVAAGEEMATAFARNVAADNYDGGGSSGCDAGFGIFALVAAAGVALGRRKG